MEVRLVLVEYWGSSSRRCTMGAITEVDSPRPGKNFQRDSPGHGGLSPGDFLPVLVGSPENLPKSQRLKHLKRYHNKALAFKCGICNEEIGTIKQVKAHQSRRHPQTDEPPPEAPDVPPQPPANIAEHSPPRVRRPRTYRRPVQVQPAAEAGPAPAIPEPEPPQVPDSQNLPEYPEAIQEPANAQLQDQQYTPNPPVGTYPPVQAPRKTTENQQRWLQWIDNIRDSEDLTAANDRITREIVEKSTQPREAAGPPRAPRPPPRPRNTPNHYDPKAAAFLQKLYCNNRSRAFKKITSAQGDEGEYCTIDPVRLVDHFSWVHQLPAENPIPHDVELPHAPDNEDIVTPFKEIEVMNRLWKTSNSAPGKDGIRYSAIRKLDPGCIVMIALYNKHSGHDEEEKETLCCCLARFSERFLLCAPPPHPGLGLNRTALDLLKNINETSTSTIKTAQGESRPLPIRAGVRQGCPLSPIIFNITNRGFKIGDHDITVLAYADDLVLAADTPEDLQNILNRVGETAAYCGLTFRPEKCASLTLDCRYRNICHTALAEGQAYEHLGIPTGYHVDQSPEDTIDRMTFELERLDTSLLAPWQKIDALSTFILPKISFVLRGCQVQKNPLKVLDKKVKKALKAWMNLPQRASPELLYVPMKKGGAGKDYCSTNKIPHRTVGAKMRLNP
ncbi:hypothetical protein JTB14_028761 [Gonioctena quinquepunctata]|nr:hypothetical protein JTB14_028761 [Gonioctena quinquepunctata]